MYAGSTVAGSPSKAAPQHALRPLSCLPSPNLEIGRQDIPGDVSLQVQGTSPEQWHQHLSRFGMNWQERGGKGYRKPCSETPLPDTLQPRDKRVQNIIFIGLEIQSSTAKTEKGLELPKEMNSSHKYKWI